MKNEIQNNKLQLLGKLAASLAHEIRNPLSALKLNLDMLKLGNEEMDKESLECISACLESVERIDYLIETTLDLSRKNNNSHILISLNEVINKTKQIFLNKSQRHSIKLIYELSDGLPRVKINNNELLQILHNLINNAFEASKPDTMIKISTYSEEGFVYLSVADQGKGIKEENKDKVFNDFYTNKSSGTGIGLSVCKKLLNEVNAEIYFESQEGVGTTFYVKFPVNN